MDSRRQPLRHLSSSSVNTESINASQPNSPVTCQTLTASQAAKFTGIGVRSWWRFVSSGRAPKPIYIGRSARWLKSAVSEWLQQGCPPCRR